MRSALALSIAVLLVACRGGGDPGGPTGVTDSDTLRVLGGPLECHSCSQVAFEIGGPGLDGVTYGVFIARDGSGAQLRADLELRRFTGDSGVVLQARVSFRDTVRVGEYDLRLLTPDRNLPTGSRTLSKVLKVTEAWFPPAGETPPAMPGDTSTTPIPPPPPPPPSSGTLEIAVTVTGVDQDLEFSVFSGASEDDWDYPYLSTIVPGIPVTWAIPVGTFTVKLGDVRANCNVQGGASRQVTSTAGQLSRITFEVSCSPAALVLVRATFSGELPIYAGAYCEDRACQPTSLDARGEALLMTGAGERKVRLSLPLNCAVSGSNPVTVAAVGGGTVRAEFAVSCTPTIGTVRVIVNASGADVDGAYTLVIGPHGIYSGCEEDDCSTVPLSANTPLSLVFDVGSLQFLLRDVAANCAVTSGNPAQVYVLGGTTVDLEFDVTCN